MSPSTLDRFYLILTIILIPLLFSHPSSSASAVCSELYGQPDLQSCWDLLFSQADGIGLEVTSRVFHLHLRSKPLDILSSQWRKRQQLPYLKSKGNCKLALLAMELSDRTFTYDTSTWTHIFMSGFRIQNQCVATTKKQDGSSISSGGNILTGDHRRLALILYAAGSHYDRKVLLDLANGQDVIVEQNVRYEDFQGGTNTTGGDTPLDLVDPITPSARNATPSTVPVGEPDRGRG